MYPINNQCNQKSELREIGHRGGKGVSEAQKLQLGLARGTGGEQEGSFFPGNAEDLLSETETVLEQNQLSHICNPLCD